MPIKHRPSARPPRTSTPTPISDAAWHRNQRLGAALRGALKAHGIELPLTEDQARSPYYQLSPNFVACIWFDNGDRGAGLGCSIVFTIYRVNAETLGQSVCEYTLIAPFDESSWTSDLDRFGRGKQLFRGRLPRLHAVCADETEAVRVAGVLADFCRGYPERQLPSDAPASGS